MNSERQIEDSESTPASADVLPNESGAGQASPVEIAPAPGERDPSYVAGSTTGAASAMSAGFRPLTVLALCSLA